MSSEPSVHSVGNGREIVGPGSVGAGMKIGPDEQLFDRFGSVHLLKKRLSSDETDAHGLLY